MANQDFGKIKKFGPKPEMARIMEALSQKKGESIKQQGVIKDSESEGSKAALTANEITRYKKIFNILKETVFPGPEAGKVDRPAQVEKTQISSAISKFKPASGGKLPGGLGAAGLAGLVAILGGVLGKDILVPIMKGLAFLKSIPAVLAKAGGVVKGLDKMFKTFKNIFQGLTKMFSAITKPISAIGTKLFKGAGMLVKFAAGIGKHIGKYLKFIPIVGTMLSLYDAYKHFNKGEYGLGSLELVYAISSIIPGGRVVAKGLIAGASLLVDILDEKGYLDSVGKTFGIAKGWLGKMLGKAWENTKKVFSTIGDTFLDLFNTISEWVVGSVKQGLDMVKKVLPNAGDFAKSGMKVALGPAGQIGGLIMDLTDKKAAPEKTNASVGSQAGSTIDSVSTKWAQDSLSAAKATAHNTGKMADTLDRVLFEIENLNKTVSGGKRPTGSAPLKTNSDEMQEEFYGADRRFQPGGRYFVGPQPN